MYFLFLKSTTNPIKQQNTNSIAEASSTSAYVHSSVALKYSQLQNCYY